MSFSSAVGGLAAPRIFHHAGVDYTVTHLTAAKRAEFERALQDRALSAVVNLRGKIGDEAYHDAYTRCVEQIASGRFSFYSEATQRAIQTPGGLLTLAAVLFGTDADTMARLMQERTDDVKSIIEGVLAESTPANPPGPAAGQAAATAQPEAKKRRTR